MLANDSVSCPAEQQLNSIQQENVDKWIEENSLEGEKWQSVINCYTFVSSLGRVFTAFYTYDGIRPRAGQLRNGYYRVELTDTDKKRKGYDIHRLVALAFVPNPENKPQVHHKNAVRTDNRADNLMWVNEAEHSQLHQEMKQKRKERLKKGKQEHEECE